jgi:hypothetical protein
VARIDLVRSGGFAGQQLRAAVDTDTDPDGDWYAGQLAALDLPALAGRAPGEPQPDRYHYALSVEGDDGSSHRLEFGEASLPDDLRRLVEQLESRARGR